MKLHYILLTTALVGLSTYANAQKNFTEGLVTIETTMQNAPATTKMYFSPDSSAMMITMGPANIKVLMDAKETFMAVMLDVPVANMKKAGVATPAEIEQITESLPKLTFKPTTDTKTISGFACKKVVATDASGKNFDVWVTNDISVPMSAIPIYYRTIGGFPVEYTSFQQGQANACKVISVTGEKAPKNTFCIPADFTKGTMDSLQQQ